MRGAAAYLAVSATALVACTAVAPDGRVLYPPAPDEARLAGASLSVKLEPRRFSHEGRVYLVDLRERRSAGRPLPDGMTPGIEVTGYDIAVSREGAQLEADYASRAEAANVAARYCSVLGGTHDDRGAPVFYSAMDAGGNAEWVFPGWCPLGPLRSAEA